MAKVVWTQLALQSFEEALDGLSRFSTGSVQTFGAAVFATLGRIESFPQVGRIVPEYKDPNVREMIVRSHRLVYRIRDESVEVLLVRHGSRLLLPELPSDT